MPEIVRTERRNSGGSARLRDRCPQRVRSALCEETRIRVPVLARSDPPLDRVRENVRKIDLESPSRLRRLSAESHSSARLVVVTDARQVDRGDARSAPVEEEERKSMLRRQESINARDVLRCRRVDLLRLFARQLHDDAITRRVGLDASVIEDHRDRLD
jgi:hypothetical protein